MNGYDGEVQALRAGVSCAVVLEQRGWQLDKRDSPPLLEVSVRTRRRADREPRGPGLVGPNQRPQGDVFALLQFLKPSLNFGQVRRMLRELSGIAPFFPVAPPPKRDKAPELPPAQRWRARPLLARGSRTWRYLLGERALQEPVLAAASRADAVREGPYGSAWFAHRDGDGEVVGIEMRGPDYRGFSADSHKTLFRLPGRVPSPSLPVTRLVVCEAPIDAMSLAGIERLRADTLYVATAGGMGPETVAALQALLQDLAAQPGTVLVHATDADPARERHAAKLAALAADAGVCSGRILPFGGRKDWNDVAQARRSSPDFRSVGRSTGISGPAHQEG